MSGALVSSGSSTGPGSGLQSLIGDYPTCDTHHSRLVMVEPGCWSAAMLEVLRDNRLLWDPTQEKATRSEKEVDTVHYCLVWYC